MSKDKQKNPAPGAEDWAGIRGERWLADLDRFEAMLAPIGESLLEAAELAPGAHVLDVGCGGGWTTRQIARRVGPGGTATGLDIAPMLVAEAARRAAAEGLQNIRFQLGDAAHIVPEGAPFDRLMSRFGVMFFEDPHAAYASLAQLLAPGGRMDLAVWAAPSENPWMTEMRAAVGRHLPLPKPDPRAPGPFQLADEAYLLDILASAGLESVSLDLRRAEQVIGGPGLNPSEVVDFALRAFAVAELLDNASPARRAAVRDDLEQVYARHHRPEGVVMDAAWIHVKAHKPG